MLTKPHKTCVEWKPHIYTFVLKAGESFVIGACEQECTCEGGIVYCVALTCDAFSTCDLIEGILDCRCDTHYTGDGRECTGKHKEPSNINVSKRLIYCIEKQSKVAILC